MPNTVDSDIINNMYIKWF